MKVICSNIKCEYCNAKNVCQKDEIILTFNIVNTKHQGHQEYLRCKNYKKSKLYQEIEDSVKELFGDDKE